jgi:hypothetical protein
MLGREALWILSNNDAGGDSGYREVHWEELSPPWTEKRTDESA